MIAPDSRAVASWLFNEQADSILPSDGTGNLGDLADDATTTVPSVTTDAITGHGRDFVAGSATALLAADTDDDLLLTREVSIISLLALDVDAQDTYGSDGTIVQRGEGTAGDALSWALRLSVVDLATRAVKVYLEWETEASALVTDVGAEFTWPEGETLLIGAVREVVGGQFVCHYYVNAGSIDGDTSALDVGGTSGADVWVGGRYNGATYGGYLDAVVDAIEIYNEAISAEEFRLLFLRMSEDVPAGAAAIKSLSPPDVYSTNEDSSIQRELKLHGSGLGVVRSLVRHLRDYIWPWRAWGSTLERWEFVTKHSPKAGDDITTRRNRITSFLGTIRGFALVDIKAVLEETLDLDSADIEILEYDNDLSHSFSTDPGDYIQDVGNAAIAVTSGYMQYLLTSDDVTFDGNYGTAAPITLWTLADELDAWFSCSIRRLAGSASASVGCMVVGNRAANEYLLFGIKGSNALQYAIFSGGAMSSWTNVGSESSFLARFYRIRCNGNGEFELRQGSTAAIADASTPLATVTGGPTDVSWAGFAVVTDSTSHPSLSAEYHFDDLLIHAPNGHPRFNWYAYRNPALPGNPDMEGANLVVKRVKPAHTDAAAITQQSVLCDDTVSGCDREPIGL